MIIKDLPSITRKGKAIDDIPTSLNPPSSHPYENQQVEYKVRATLRVVLYYNKSKIYSLNYTYL